jgi:beta-lactamase regulating signal transducer with metallopeptidase domain/protocatechuate 3,4-dioxygenase beta subunit
MTISFAAASQSIAGWLTDYFLAASVVLVILLLAWRWIRQPAHRIAAAWTVMIELALLAVACALPFWPKVSLLTAKTANVTNSLILTGSPDSSAIGAAKPQEGFGADSATSRTLSAPMDALSDAPKTRKISAAQPLSPPTPVHRPWTWPEMLSVGYLAGMSAIGLWLLGGIVAAVRIFRQSRAADDALIAVLSRITGGKSGVPRLLVNRRIETAVAMGALRPTIVLPVALAEMGPTPTLRAVLAHECAHVRHRDLWLLALGRYLLLLLFAHPLFWWLRRAVRHDQELLADAFAAGDARHDYAAELLAVVRHSARPSPITAAGAVGLWEGPSQLTRRIATLLDETFRIQPKGSRRWKIQVLSILFLMGAACSLITLKPARSDDEPKKPVVAAGSKLSDSKTVPNNAEPNATVAVLGERYVKIDDIRDEFLPDKKARRLSFRVHVKKGERFCVTITEKSKRRDFAMGNILFESEQDEPIPVTMTFFEHDRNKTDGDVFKGTADLITVDSAVRGVYPPGVTQLVSTLLGDLPPNEREIVVPKSDSDWGAVGADGRRVLLVYPKGKKAETFESIEPRAEIVVAMQSHSERRPTKPDPVARLNTIWSRQQSEIGTAQIEFLHVNMGRSNVQSLSPEDVEKIIADAQLADHPENLQSVLAKILTADTPKDAPNSRRTFYCVGSKSRENYSVDGRLEEVRYIDGTIDLSYCAANQQVDIISAENSRLGHVSLGDFRISPSSLQLPPAEFQTRTNEAGQFVIASDKTPNLPSIIADPATGFVYRRTTRGDGKIVRDEYQFGQVKYEPNIVYPKLKISFSYSIPSGELNSVEAFRIDSAKFNEAFPADAFTIALPPPLKLYDYRKDGFHSQFHSIKTEEPDLINNIRETIIAGKPNEGKSSGSVEAPAESSKPASSSGDSAKKSPGAESMSEETKAEPETKDYTFPITVTGRAIDLEGKPIAKAAIYLSSTRSDWKRLAETVTDEEGHYLFRDIPLPIERATSRRTLDEGSFEVFGQAPGYGFAWRPEKCVLPQPGRNSFIERDDADLPTRFMPGDKIELDLKFPPPAKLSGRIVDDRGNPIPNTKVTMSFCEPIRPEGYPTEGSFNTMWSSREFNMINGHVPPEMKTRTTDADGRYEFPELPPDCRFLIDVNPPGFAGTRLWAATCAPGRKGLEGRKIHIGTMDLTFNTAIDTPVVVLYDDSRKPAAKVLISAYDDRGGTGGRTDSEGRTSLRVPAGDYRVQILPAKGTPYWITETTLAVPAKKPESPAPLLLRPAAEVEVQVLDAETGKGIPGVDLWSENPSLGAPGPTPGRFHDVHSFRSYELETNICHVERPRTNADGMLKALFQPGKQRIGVAYAAFPEGYEPVEPDGKEIDAQIGEPVRVVFHLRKK